MTETLFEYAAQLARDAGMAAVSQNAGEQFRQDAKSFVLDYLRTHGPTAGEDLTDACWKAGIRAHDSRAMGPVFMSLCRKGLIEKAGTAVRRKGHASDGGKIWKLTQPNN